MIYFTGCTHFGHLNIIKFAKRPFESVEEMDEILIERWNRVITPKDTVIHHGDFAYKNGQNRKSYNNKLNGNIIFLQGNHDPFKWGVDYYTFKYKKIKFVCFHYPIEEWDGWYNGSIHTHCHTHKHEFVSAERRFNVTVEACEYTPISIEQILERNK